MPLYEYRCEEDGSTLTLLRPMAQANDPVEDPDGQGRTFVRVHSTFMVEAPASSQTGFSVDGGGCGCGRGGCSH
ncbi:MAG: FmdB family transcriptional regulator [Phycisphaerae bacterium]|nr:FmdB family transcriptional regulator [Phycisphaerae bacterium]